MARLAALLGLLTAGFVGAYEDRAIVVVHKVSACYWIAFLFLEEHVHTLPSRGCEPVEQSACHSDVFSQSFRDAAALGTVLTEFFLE